MEIPSIALQRAVSQLSRLSGVGSRTALRLAIEIIKWDDEDIEQLAESIHQLKLKNSICKTCFNLSDSDKCSICENRNRDSSVICVIEDIRSLIAIENTMEYNGIYHVLGGLISPINGIGPASLTIDALVERIKSGNIKEIFFALSTTLEGDTTMFYLHKKVKSLGVYISTISRGIALGNEIEYTDNVTLGKSISNRISCNELYGNNQNQTK